MRAAVILAAVLLAACGGAAAPSATSAPAGAGADATPAGTQPPAAAQATGSGPTLASLLGVGKSADYKVTYKWTTTANGETQVAEQTWYQQGARSRFDFNTDEGNLSFFVLADGSFMCTSGAGEETMCLGMPKEAGLAGNPGAAFQLEVEDRPDQFDPTFEGIRQIAGQAAQCFSLSAAAAAYAAGGESRMCYSSGGIPLLIEQKGGGFSMLFEATGFTTSVGDADFKLPATPTKYGP